MNALKIFTTPYVVIELVLIYIFSSSYGFGNFLLEAFLSAILGLFLIFRMGIFSVFGGGGVFAGLNGGILNAFGFGLGGFLLCLPGILSDIAGAIVIVLSFFTKPKMQNFKYNFEEFSASANGYESSSHKSYTQDEIIDVEVVSESKSVR